MYVQRLGTPIGQSVRVHMVKWMLLDRDGKCEVSTGERKKA